jgi:hypothetical protein
VAKKAKVPVSTRAVIQRINRRLKADNQVLRATRGARAQFNLGYYWVHEYARNLALQTHVNPGVFARELGVLADYEAVVNDNP